MGKIDKIKINNFRNFENCEISFEPNCNIFFGNNGCGKTNLLECISLIGKGRGFRNSSIENLIFKKEKNFFILCDFTVNEDTYNLKIYSEINEGKYKKITSINDEVSKDVNTFIDSSISFLFFLPEMERLYVSSPSFRRNFLDKLIFTQNKSYNKLINKYKKYLLERSKILQNNNYDENWMSTIEKEISFTGIEIYNSRLNQLSILNEQINIINKSNNYPFKVELTMIDDFFQNDISQDMYIHSLRDLRYIDSKIGGSKIGPHKSDFKALVNNDMNASQLSTGQQKTLVLMILIAQCNYLITEKKIKPVLLFDEICSHLDDVNRKILLDLTNQFDIQIFLTGTDKSLFSFMSTNAKFYNITDI